MREDCRGGRLLRAGQGEGRRALSELMKSAC